MQACRKDTTNVQHLTVLAELAEGRWPYPGSQIQTTAPLRYFTLASALELVSGAGLAVRHTHALLHQAPATDGWAESGNTVRLGRLTLTNLTRDEVSHFYAGRYLILAQKPAAAT
jgi:hypothetical protein